MWLTVGGRNLCEDRNHPQPSCVCVCVRVNQWPAAIRAQGESSTVIGDSSCLNEVADPAEPWLQRLSGWYQIARSWGGGSGFPLQCSRHRGRCKRSHRTRGLYYVVLQLGLLHDWKGHQWSPTIPISKESFHGIDISKMAKTFPSASSALCNLVNAHSIGDPAGVGVMARRSLDLQNCPLLKWGVPKNGHILPFIKLYNWYRPN